MAQGEIARGVIVWGNWHRGQLSRGVLSGGRLAWGAIVQGGIVLEPVIHILPNISRRKGNQTMKLGQLIECIMRNLFLEKSYTKGDEETSLIPFSQNLKLNISLDE